MADRVGQQLGNYQLIRLLGEGGFAEVYLGEHVHLGTQAAVKVLHTQLTSDDVDKFRTEARTIARLIHPHVVRVLEFGVEGKTPFLVMDYATRGSLRNLHPKGVALPLSTVVLYVKQVADALQYAHDEKVIHRDVKQENMLVGRNNDIFLSDFGIAMVAQSSRYQSTQEMAGTMAYMAPEQIQGKPRPASDQYSLGIVVYEWLSGARPFHGSLTELVGQHLSVPPQPLREKVPAIPPDVEEVVMTALAKDPKQRFMSIQAFANALEQASQSVQPAQSSLQTGMLSSPSSSRSTEFSPPPALNTPLSEMEPQIDDNQRMEVRPVTGPSDRKIVAAESKSKKVNDWRVEKRQVMAMIASTTICASLFSLLAYLSIYNPPPYVNVTPGNIFLHISIYIFILLGLILVTPQFFGAIYGPWVGFVTGGVGSLIGTIILGILLTNLFTYAAIWLILLPILLGIALAGFISGFAMFKVKGRFNIGRTLGFSSLGAVVGGIPLGAIIVLATFVSVSTLTVTKSPNGTVHYSNQSSSIHSILPQPFVVYALVVVLLTILIYIALGMILLPALLVIYKALIKFYKIIAESR